MLSTNTSNFLVRNFIVNFTNMKRNNKFNWRTVRKIYEWCISYYGASKYNGTYPSIKYIDTLTHEDFEGDAFYEEIDNTIYINSKSPNITELEHLARTVIHEYAHYKYHNMNKYYRLAEVFDHQNHPMEIEANQIENRDIKKCLAHMKYILGF
jgi:hypothetical protein